jgi:hypothetical protein
VGVYEGVLSLNKIRSPYMKQVCGGAAPQTGRPAAQRRTLRIVAGSPAADGGHPTDNGPPATNAVTDKIFHEMTGRRCNEILSDKPLTKAEITYESRPYRDLSRCSADVAEFMHEK